MRFSAMSYVAMLVTVPIAFLGCKGKGKDAPEPPPPVVTVAQVQQKTVPVYLKYIGATEAVKSVDIRARVEGFLQKRDFTEGMDVNKGDVLFLIDPSPLQAQLDQNVAQLAKDEAAVAFARSQVQRYRSLVEQDFVTREQFESFCTQEKEAMAAVEADRAAIEEARLNLSYCTVKAPLDGRIGRTLVHEGNLVGAGDKTQLASIVQLDPIYVYFNPSAQDFRQIMQNKQAGALPVTVGFSDGGKHPYPGKVDFTDNTVDPTTSTVAMRAVVPNPEKTLLPGMFVEVTLFLTEVPDTLLIPEIAILEDQSGTYVYVVDKDNKVQHRSVTVRYKVEGMRVVLKGLKAGESVVTQGLQKVRPGMEVQPKPASKETSAELGKGKTSGQASANAPGKVQKPSAPGRKAGVSSQQ